MRKGGGGGKPPGVKPLLAIPMAMLLGSVPAMLLRTKQTTLNPCISPKPKRPLNAASTNRQQHVAVPGWAYGNHMQNTQASCL